MIPESLNTFFKVDKMTPAIDKAKQSKITYSVHEYDHEPTAESYGIEAAQKLGIAPEKVFKTLVVASGPKELTVVILSVSQQLHLKSLAKTVGVKKMVMADPKLVERTTGYVLGGVSPLGQKKQLRTVIDASAKDHQTIFVSAGRRGLEIELSPLDLASLTRATFAKVAQ